MTKLPSITFYVDRLWILRSIKTTPGGQTSRLYYETPSVWNRSPMGATIFRTFEAAENHLALWRLRDIPLTIKFADGSTEVVDVVSLHGELMEKVK